MPSYLRNHTNYTPNQREKLEDNQVQNAAGGYVYQLDTFDRVRRFLIMGTEGGTFYETERDLTKENTDNLKAAIKEDGLRVVQMTYEVSKNGEAAKNDMALYVLALAFTHGDAETKAAVHEVYNQVARIGTHHLMFVSFINDMRGWGRSLRKLISNWYTDKDNEELAYQAVKYQNREGWTHEDVMRKAHVGTHSVDSTNHTLYRWITNNTDESRAIKGQERKYDQAYGELPEIVHGYEIAKGIGNDENSTPKDIIPVINRYNLTHEMVPNKFKNSTDVWEALLPNMLPTALIRNLGKMTSIGMFDPYSRNTKYVLDRLTPESTKRARIHPINTLVAMTTYNNGTGFRGSLSWSPNKKVSKRLEEVFYWGFNTIEPSNKNMLLALDISASMFWNYPIQSCPQISCGEIAGCMAMVTARTEPNYHICGFDGKFSDLPIDDTSRLEDVIKTLKGQIHGSTDCALPMTESLERGWKEIDGFCIYTDNETWYGSIHPKAALEIYRKKTGRDSRVAVCGMTATDTSIADSSVPYMADFVGISTNTPRMISQFIAGKF